MSDWNISEVAKRRAALEAGSKIGIAGLFTHPKLLLIAITAALGGEPLFL